VLRRLPYLALTGMVAFLQLLPMSSTDKDIEILALRHQLAVLQRQIDKPRFTPPDRAFLAALLHTLPRPTLRRLGLIVSPDTILRWHRDFSATTTPGFPARNGRDDHPPFAASRRSSCAWPGKTPAGDTAELTANSPP
jgi:hypothetical protein